MAGPGAARRTITARAAELLRVDDGQTIDALTAAVRAAGRAGQGGAALLGLSGGLDSAVLAAVAVRALGAGRVHPLYIYDRTSSSAGRRRARAVAAWLGLALEEVSIEAEMRAAGVYTTGAARLTAVSGRLNRLLYGLYTRATGETPFVLSLRVGEAGGAAAPDLRAQRLHHRLALQAEAGFAARHRHRRALLEARAGAGEAFLLGAANRTEWLTGWFVKGGVDDLSDQPLKGLYKTQVRQLAAALGVPASVPAAAPSPDMMRGIGDELALGLPYPALDLALAVIEGELSREEAGRAGLTAADLDRTRQLVRLSGWKRAPPAS